MGIYAVETLLILVAIGAGVFGLLHLLRSGVMFGVKRHKLAAPWKVETDVLTNRSGNNVLIQLIKYNEDPIIVKELNPRAADFDMQLYEAQAEARNTAMALNNRR